MFIGEIRLWRPRGTMEAMSPFSATKGELKTHVLPM
jgi:hypothetical protein